VSDLRDRLTQLTAEQRVLLDRRLRSRGIDPAATVRGAAPTAAAGASAPEDPAAWRERVPPRAADFSLYFFSDDGSAETDSKYRLVLESARFADEHGFAAVWTPERHFQPFGGLYPNPSVLGAALAAVTRRVGIRAGSVALPLHHPVRVAEEWAVVDNLSGGRVAVSFASGWHPDDFVLFPTPFAERKEAMFRGIDQVRRLWRGEALAATAPDGREVEVRSLPRPLQSELPVWITSAGNPETWTRAGSIGANVLAALVGYSFEDLAGLVAAYRAARAEAGHDPEAGRVTLAAHTFVGEDDTRVRDLVREPMSHYLATYLRQFRHLASETSPTHDRDSGEIARMAFEHFFETHTLLGTQSKCARVVDAMLCAGVDEVACLVDFGLEADEVLAALPRLAELCRHYARAGRAAATEAP
jgi:natural product biosynthesis luciferase-like monooxygenase protein